MKEGYTKIRNKGLAHAFSCMNLIEEWGTGIPKLINEMKEYGLREPEIIDEDFSLKISLYRERAEEEGKPQKAESGEIPAMNKYQRIIHGFLEKKGEADSSEIAGVLGLKQRQTTTILRQMIDAGIIEKNRFGQLVKYSLK